MRKTIKIVQPPREFMFNDNQLVGIDVTFTDGSDGSLVVKPANKDAAHAALAGLVDKDAEFDLEAKPMRNSREQWKIKGYPGKPGGGGFGGGGGRDNSPSIEAQNAVNNAVRLVTDLSTGTVDVTQAMVLVERIAPRMHELTQSLKNGKSSPTTPGPRASVTTSAGVTTAAPRGESQEPAQPAGVGDASWDELNAKASGESEVHGEGATGSPDNGSGEGGGLDSASPSDPLASAELWAEATAAGWTKVRVLTALKKANQPVSDASSVTESQLSSLLHAGASA